MIKDERNCSVVKSNQINLSYLKIYIYKQNPFVQWKGIDDGNQTAIANTHQFFLLLFFGVGHARHQNLIKKALPLLLLLILCLLDPDVFLIGPKKKKRKNLNIKCLCALNFVAG